MIICGDPEDWKQIANLTSKNPPIKIIAVTLERMNTLHG